MHKQTSIFKQSFIHLKDKKATDSAAVLSFSTLFAIVPMLTLAFSVFSLSHYFVDFQSYLENFLFNQLLPKNYDTAVIYLQKFITSARKISGISTVFLLIVVIVLFREIDSRIGGMWGEQNNRHIGVGLVSYVLILLLGPILLGASLFMSSYISTTDIFIFIPMGALLIAALPILLSAFGLAMLYFIIPKQTPSIKNAIKAGLIGAVLLEIVKSIMLIYLNYFPFYQIIYGALSMILLFMLWVYFSWIIVLFGASYCFILDKKDKNV